ncbi:hypothetical protein GRX01_09830 [Halobaculum sp. WSA2]|uniref:Uncharacterized protein n=1 Tax=Halobaculum saliterrae TaxID=2073113 RepID=A0A6B0SRT1_9EURY|nr:hypothetical protein [Halobaculum saliterrae]MXR41634.1 hypothetical protein [Halobaculum saliterrae]
MTEDRDGTDATDGGRDDDTISDVDHEGPETSANAVWARGDDVDSDAEEE